MAFSEKLKNEIELYCNNHLPQDSWYENEFSFIQGLDLKNRIITEFKLLDLPINFMKALKQQMKTYYLKYVIRYLHMHQFMKQ